MKLFLNGREILSSTTYTTMFYALLLTLAHQNSSTMLTLNVDGVQRQALLFGPANQANPAPLVFAFHGHGGGARQFSRIALSKEWPEAIVVYPQGLPTKTPNDPAGGRNGWEMSRTETNKDIRFFDALLSKITAEYKVDRSRIFCMGHSNGGGFTYTLWDTRPNIFKGMGPAAANGLRTATPKPAFIMYGTNDPIVKPENQLNCINRILKNNQNTLPGNTEGHLTKYGGNWPVWVWTHDNGHSFQKDAVPAMIEFFKSLG